jgi:hypothetical protein
MQIKRSKYTIFGTHQSIQPKELAYNQLENLFSWQLARSTTCETLLDNQVKVSLPSSIHNCPYLFS